ncbi:MAG: efflux RND transporter permease subunit [Xanthomonadales bacterium]|nr:efflux RND transporter permease subunit [Xanthomonadales bacterium]MDH3924435.1 efflux RND transporter permease subunit [Xanthomonadales bacterium]MDH3939598.1 efflux RND transporter permease subunit [Xanthomonadales bacterium]MDH4002580.1 efflux RND transporter permease subunit [Xanthomonadales bacterium]
MIEAIIRWSIANRFLVVLLSVILAVSGTWVMVNTPVDAIPDLSDVQVIIKTPFPGQAPQVVEDQVTYPLTTAMLSVPGASTVRGYSFFGDSYVYVIFEDGTDLYWARSRVLEYLNQVAGQLPPSARPALGPDATGVGWIYEYALQDRSGQHDLAQLRSIQDWFLKYELQTVTGVAEVATVGGMVRQYQVVLNPDALRAYGLPLAKVRSAIQRGNREVGGSVIEMGEAEYMIRATGYLKSKEDLAAIPLGMNQQGTPIRLADVADIRIGPQMRRGIAELDGEGEVVGGIVVMRFGENARKTIAGVKERLAELQKSLPEGVEIIETYDRSLLIERAVDNLQNKLLLEFLVVALVCLVFLFHLRSSLVVVISLPLGILAAFLVMNAQGLNANIMSLGGIAIAIGAMVDAAIVMIETLHKKMEQASYDSRSHWDVVTEAAVEVGPPLFFSLLIITLSFLPVFTLQAQEGRLFAPLAFTKTYAMAAAAGLSITLVPVLMGYFIRGKIVAEHRNSINRLLVWLYRPLVGQITRHPWSVVLLTAVLVMIGFWPVNKLGSEFMPDLNEGDLMYMPTTFPGISIGKAQELLQQTDKLIRTVPEVKRVFGKIGRAETATDPAPLTMIETLIQLKPEEDWREGMTIDDIKEELNQRVQLPGLTNAWVWPIKTRIDMLATGIKTPVGIKVAGPDLGVIQQVGEDIEAILQEVPGTASAFSERVAGGRYVTVDILRDRASRYGLNIDDVQDIVRTAIGGMNVTETIEGLERYPVNLRYPRGQRDSVEKLRELAVVTPSGQQIPLSAVADIRVEDGPPMIKSENARLNGWIFVDIEGVDLGTYVSAARKAVSDQLDLPPGYSINWSGQYEYMERARQRLTVVVPITLMTIIILLFLNFRNMTEVLIILGTLPTALVGGIWLLYLLGYHMSVAVGVGFIALAGVAVEIGVVMLVYLKQALASEKLKASQEQRALTSSDLVAAVTNGALMRVRPIMMTVAAIVAGLLPIMFGSGTGSEVMRRIAAPMVGGMVSATVLTLALIPAIFLLWQRRTLKRDSSEPAT